MPESNLSVFAQKGPAAQPSPADESTVPHKPTIQELALKLQDFIKTKEQEEQVLRKQGKMAPLRSLSFPYVVQLEKSPADKIRLMNGINTLLIISSNPTTRTVGYAKYAFLDDESKRLVEDVMQLLTGDRNCDKLETYIRPSGF